MWTMIKGFFSGMGSKLLEVLLLVGSIIGAMAAIYGAGKKSEKADELKAVNNEVGKAHEVENENSKLPPGAAADELSKHWRG